MREKYVGTKQRDRYEKLFSKYKVRGIVYTGGNDGLCVVPYDFSSAVPIAVYNPETGKFEQSGNIVVENYGRFTRTGEKFNFDYDVFYDRILNNQDDGHKFGYKFDAVDVSAIIKGINLDGEETSFRRNDFYGVANEEYLPEWAREKLEDIRMSQSDNGESDAMTMEVN